MTATLVLDRIAAWERAGVIDHELAERLRTVEAAEGTVEATEGTVAPPDAARAAGTVQAAGTAAAYGAAVAPPATSRIRSSGFILEFFAYLGGLFLLLAWYAWLANELPPGEAERDRAIGIAALVPAVLLGVAGWILAARDDDRVRRAAAVALVAMVPNGGVATWALLQAGGFETFEDGPVTLVAGAGVAFALAIAARLRRPSALTQGALIAAWAVFALELASWAEGGIWADEPRGGTARAAEEQRLRSLVRLAWWWLVAAAPAALLVLRPDGRDGHESRDAVTRIGIGVIAVLGSASVALGTDDWGTSILGAWPAAGVMIGVGAVFVAAARASGSRIHLVTAGASILIGLTYLNAELVVDAVGAPAALLVEGLILLGVATAGWAAGRFVTRRAAAPADG